MPAAAPHAKEPAVPQLSAAERSLVENKVRHFYEKHNPSKLSEVTSIMQKWTGREKELIAGLEQKYGKFEEQISSTDADNELC